jgi:hypothetical protein
MLNSSIATIGSTLSMRTVTSSEPLDHVIYKEDIPGGFTVLEQNIGSDESTMDLEFLFKAVMDSSEDFLSLLPTESEK